MTSTFAQMLDALVIAREFISFDRNALADTVTYGDGHIDPDDADELADYDDALVKIDAAIQQATREAQ